MQVDWATVFPGARRVDLPTYAFQRRRYWLEAAAPKTATDPVEAEFWAAVENSDLDGLATALNAAEADERDSLTTLLPLLTSWRTAHRDRSVADAWRYRVEWKPVPEPTAAPTGTWLVVVSDTVADDDRHLVDDARRALTERGVRPTALTVAPARMDRSDLAAEIRALTADGEPLGGVLSLLALDGTAHPDHPVLSNGLAATTLLIQALGDAGVGAPLWIATRGAVETGAAHDTGPVDPGQAQLWGLGRVLGLEHPDRWGGLVDLPPGALDERARSRFAAALAGIGDEDQIAVRPSGALVRRLAHAPAAGAAEPSWRPTGTVLVTGGTGALGAHLARRLADLGAERIVLTGRRGMAAPGAADLCAELAARGPVVSVESCDVADRGALAGLLARLDAEGAPVRSVFHAAGVGDGASLGDTTLAEVADVLSAKVAGADNLDALLGGDLDAFVLYSSNAGVWGSGGLAAYAAANAHLDALAQRRRALGLPATSVAWGLWGGGGMADGDNEEFLRRRGLRPMDPDLAVTVLHRAVDDGEAFLAVADVDWERFTPGFTAARPRPLIADLPEARRALEDTAPGGEAAGAALRGRLAALPAAEADRALLQLVRTHVGAVLGHSASDAVPAARAFRDMGFDSLTAVELRNRLNAATGLTLPTTLVFDHPTPEALVELLRSRLVPDGAGGEDAPDPREAGVRRALAAIPLHRLRDAGLLDSLLELADAHGDVPAARDGEAADPADPIDSIDSMDNETLLRLALSDAPETEWSS